MSFETDRRFEMKQRARMRTIQVPPQTQFNTEVEVDKNGKGGTSIDDLPSEILAKLVDILPLNDRLNFGATCQRFESIAKDKLPPLTARRIYLDFQDPASDLEQVITVGNGRREASRIPTYYYPRNMEGPDEGEMKWRRNDSLAWEAFTTRNFKALLSEAIAAVQKRMEITVINLVAGDLTLVSPLSEYIDKSKIESLRFHGDGKTHVSSLREGPVIATLLQDMDNLRTVEISDEGLSEYSDDSLYRQPVFTHVKELTFDSRERRKRCGFKLEMVQNLPELEDLYIFSPIEISVSSVMNLIHFIIGNVSPFRVLHLRIPLRDCVFSIPHVGKRILAEVPTFTIMRRVKSNSLIAKFADLRQRTWSLYLKKSRDEFSVFCACDELVLPPENAP